MHRNMKTNANSFNYMRVLGIMMLLMTYFVWDTAAQKISTSPTRINYKVTPGGSGRSRITVANNSTDKQGFQVTFGDFSASITGKSQFSKEGTEDRSCASWLTATPAVFELEPGETQEIQVLIDVPADSAALIARWAVAYVQLTAPENDGKGSGEGLKVQVNQSYRFGVYLFQTPPSATDSKGEISGLNYENDSFTIQGIDDMDNVNLCIYNRWGNQVYRNEGGKYNNDWYGTYNGKNLPEGTYYYIIDLGDKSIEPYTGYLQIKK